LSSGSEKSQEQVHHHPKIDLKLNFLPSSARTRYDEKYAMIFTDAKTGLKDSPAITTCNPSLFELAKTYFEKMWVTSKPLAEDVEQKDSLPVQM